MRRLLMGFAVLTFAVSVSAQHTCDAVLSLGAGKSISSRDRTELQASATDFCREYGSSSAKSSKYQASYARLQSTLSGSAASAKESQVAEKYCRSDREYREAKDAFDTYVQTQASREALDAYQQCLMTLTANPDLTFSTDAETPSELFLGLQFTSKTTNRAQAQVQVDSTGDISCSIGDKPVASMAGSSFFMPTGTAATVKCKRTDVNRAGRVLVRDLTSSNGSRFKFHWPAYDANGNLAVPTAQRLQSEIVQLKGVVDELSARPQGQGRILGTITVAGGKIEGTSGMKFDPASGEVEFPLPAGVRAVPFVSNIAGDPYVTEVHFVYRTPSQASNRFGVRRSFVDGPGPADGRSGPGRNFIAVVIGYSN